MVRDGDSLSVQVWDGSGVCEIKVLLHTSEGCDFVSSRVDSPATIRLGMVHTDKGKT